MSTAGWTRLAGSSRRDEGEPGLADDQGEHAADDRQAEHHPGHVAVYDDVLLSAHMVQHSLLIMVAGSGVPGRHRAAPGRYRLGRAGAVTRPGRAVRGCAGPRFCQANRAKETVSFSD